MADTFSVPYRLDKMYLKRNKKCCFFTPLFYKIMKHSTLQSWHGSRGGCQVNLVYKKKKCNEKMIQFIEFWMDASKLFLHILTRIKLYLLNLSWLYNIFRQSYKILKQSLFINFICVFTSSSHPKSIYR